MYSFDFLENVINSNTEKTRIFDLIANSRIHIVRYYQNKR